MGKRILLVALSRSRDAVFCALLLCTLCMGKGLHQWKCFKALVFVIGKMLWEIREV